MPVIIANVLKPSTHTWVLSCPFMSPFKKTFEHHAISRLEMT